MVTEQDEADRGPLDAATPLLRSPWTSLGLAGRIAFVVAFAATLFIPVYPINIRTYSLYWARPLEAYVFMAVAPIVAFPVAATHFAVCFYFATLIAKLSARGESAFTLRSLMTCVAILSVCLGLVARFNEYGFLVSFYSFSILVPLANILKIERIASVPIPKLSRAYAWIMLGVSIALALAASNVLLLNEFQQ